MKCGSTLFYLHRQTRTLADIQDWSWIVTDVCTFYDISVYISQTLPTNCSIPYIEIALPNPHPKTQSSADIYYIPIHLSRKSNLEVFLNNPIPHPPNTPNQRPHRPQNRRTKRHLENTPDPQRPHSRRLLHDSVVRRAVCDGDEVCAE